MVGGIPIFHEKSILPHEIPSQTPKPLNEFVFLAFGYGEYLCHRS